MMPRDHDASAVADRANQASPHAPTGHGQSVTIPSARVVHGEVMRARVCDDEVAQIMDRLDKLQGWLVLQGAQRRGDAHFMSAATLIQDTRVLLVERCFNVGRLEPKDSGNE